MPEGPARPRRRAIVAVGVGAVTINAALLGLIAPLLPDIEARTGAGDAALGLALAAYAVPIALFSLPLGRAADAVGRRRLLVAARAVQGVGSAASWISALALVSDTAPPGKRGEALGGRWGDRLGWRGPAITGLAATALSVVALAVLPGVAGTAVGLGIYGAGFSLAMRPRFHGSTRHSKRESAGSHTASRTCSMPAAMQSVRFSAACCSTAPARISPTG